MERFTQILHGDSLIELDCFPSNYFDSIVTDPPYGLSFMNKHWDYQVPSVEFWKEALRVLKPGGHLLCFGGSRTYHRVAVNIEDAGFEIRDQLMWIYGSGFPKSLDISKAIDKEAGAEREVIGIKRSGSSSRAFQSLELTTAGQHDITKPATDEAAAWEGWGTALKPAHEPIVLARKPISEKTVAANVLKYGTGGLNIDGCRIEFSENETDSRIGTDKKVSGNTESKFFKTIINGEGNSCYNNSGRFPANILFDEDAAKLLDQQSGTLTTGAQKPVKRKNIKGWAGDMPDETNYSCPSNSGGASRFFYVAKASKKDREDGNNHPTVKPTALMQYLCRLVTPPGGIILDPFAGSGSTGKGGIIENFSVVLIEREAEYIPIIQGRIENAENSLIL